MLISTVISSLRIANLEFSVVITALMMRVHCKQQIASKLRPLLGKGMNFRLPAAGSELLLVLGGPEPSARLSHMVAMLNAKFSWHNQTLGYRNLARRARHRGIEEDPHPMLGQPSWLSGTGGERGRQAAGAGMRVIEADQTSEQAVRMLTQVKRALNERDIDVCFSPSRIWRRGVSEIPTRMRCTIDDDAGPVYSAGIVQFKPEPAF